MFDFRYHVVTIIAVFLALGVGILLGVTIGDNFVSSAEKNLRSSLQEDLQNARSDRLQARRDLHTRDDFEQQVYSTVVQNAIAGQQVGIIALKDMPDTVVSNIRDALEPSGATVAAIGTVRAPLNIERLNTEVKGTPYGDFRASLDTKNRFAKRLGSELISGGRLLRLTDQALFSSRSGNFGALDSVIYVRPRRGLKGRDRRITNRFESALLRGLAAEKIPLVGVERSDADPSQIAFFRGRDITSVDDIDLIAGRVALVFALSGAKGQFGVKSTATQLLPQTQLDQQGSK